MAEKTRAELNKYALRSGPMDLPYVPRRGYADGPYGQIHYRDTGGSDARLPLILLHQAPHTSKQFSRVYELLRERGIRAIGIDAPGFGESDATTFVPTIEDWAAVVPSVLDALVVEKANVLGHHTGALVATEVALQFPNRVNKIVLNGPFPIESEERRLEYLKYVEEKEINHVYEADGSHLLSSFNLRTKWWNKALGDGEADPKLFTRYLTEKYQGYAPFWTGHHAAFIYDQVESLKRIVHPTMILTNTGDMANENAKLAHELRPDFLYKEMEGGTFDVVDQMPIEWTDEVAAFLKD